MASIFSSGAVISSLFFELIQSSKIKEGFFLGKVEKVVQQSISDIEICSESTRYNICINSFYPLPGLGSFYSGCCKINEDYLKTLLGEHYENVVGWYRYRGSFDEMYLKEMKITEKLMDLMTHTEKLFTFAIVSGSPTAPTGTLDLNYRFSIISDSKFQPIPVVISNMKDTLTSHYVTTESSCSLYSSDLLKNVLENLKQLDPAVKDAEKMHLNILVQLKALLSKFASLNENYCERVSEVNLLKALCNSHGIIPDYQPTPIESTASLDMMEIGSPSPSPKIKSRKSITSNAASKSTLDTTNSKKTHPREKKKIQKNKSEETFFGVYTDYIKTQKSTSDENSNTLSSEKVGQSPILSQRRSFRLKASPQDKDLNKNLSKNNRGPRSVSCDPSQLSETTTSNVSPTKVANSSTPTPNKSPYRGKMKSSRMQNRSLDRSSPIRTTCQRSPSKTPKEMKSKIKDGWVQSSIT